MARETIPKASKRPPAHTEIEAVVRRRLRNRRQKLNLTLTDIAEQLEVTFQQMCKYESGVNRITAARLFQLAIALQTDPNYFFKTLGKDTADVQDVPLRSKTLKKNVRTAVRAALEADIPPSDLIEILSQEALRRRTPPQGE